MLAALAWIPRGAATAKLPHGVEDGNDMDISEPEPNAPESSSKPQSSAAGDSDEDSEVGIDQILANDLDTLSFHKRGEEDPYLKSDPRSKELFDDDELEDLQIRPTDALVVALKSGEDQTLEAHLFDDNPDESDDEKESYTPHTYVHHDIVLPSLPLCVAYTSLSIDDAIVNLIAVGMFTPGIEVWDIDRVNELEPVASLGGYGGNEHLKEAFNAAKSVQGGNKSKRKKKPKLQLREGSHSDAVMSLSWNAVQREYLASGSADTTVKVWDIESTHCACTLTHHRGKVQSVAFHPSEADLVVTGSFDRTVHLVDLRTQKSKSSWTVDSDIETCSWGYESSENYVIATTEDGKVSVFDSRKLGEGQSCLTSWDAHQGPASACSVSRDVPGLLVTGGVDKTLKVWDISEVSSGRPGELIYERPSKAGALFTLSLCPLPNTVSNASPFVVGYGGAKGSLGVADLAVESNAVRKRFLHHCSSLGSAVIEKRAARGTTTAKAGPGKIHALNQEEEDSEDSKDGDDSSSSGWESAHDD